MCERGICLWVVHPVKVQQQSCSLLWARGHKLNMMKSEDVYMMESEDI